MARELDHVALANRNHDALMYLVQDATRHPEWVATVAFYKAVQIVEALLATQFGRHSNGHDARLPELKSPQFAQIFKAYRPLYAASLVARYLEDSSPAKLNGGCSVAYLAFSDYIKPNEVVHRLLKKRLAALEQNAVQFLSEQAQSALKRVDNEPSVV